MDRIWYVDPGDRQLESERDSLAALIRGLERLRHHATHGSSRRANVLVLEHEDFEIVHCMRCGEPIIWVGIGVQEDDDNLAIWCLDDHTGSGFDVDRASLEDASNWARSALKRVEERLRRDDGE
jgi:hypothetical protein